MKQNIVFFGSGDFVIPVVKKLLDHGLDLVVTNDKNPNSNLLKFCEEKKISFLIASHASDLINHKSKILNHSVAILASFGVFIPDVVITSFPNGIINIHPSLLPKYKGPSPVQYAILNGEEVTGVTLIKLDSEIDHGPIISQKPYNLAGNETTQELLNILFEIGAEMMEEIIIKLEKGETLSETPQNHSNESWSYKISKEDGHIDIYKLNAKRYTLNAMLRAYYPWPTVWFRVPQNPPVITDSDPGSSTDVIASETKQSRLSGKIIKLLPEGKIQVEGKNPMSYKDFVNGFGEEGQELLEKLNLSN